MGTPVETGSVGVPAGNKWHYHNREIQREFDERSIYKGVGRV